MQLLICDEDTTAIEDIRPTATETVGQGFVIVDTTVEWDSYTACVGVPCVMRKKATETKEEAETEKK
jgi:hypothetical protein